MATDTDCLRTGKTFTLVDNITLSGSWTPIGNATNKFKGTFDGNSKTISGLTMTFTSTSAVLDYGGLFGYAQDAIIKNITLTGVSIINDDRTILGPQYVGGIVGRADNTDVLNSSVTGSIDATNYVGGIAGHIANGSLVSNSSSAGSVGSNASLTHVGGIVGFASTSDLTDELPDPKPEFFFAPTQIAKRTKEWGADGLSERMSAGWTAFADWADDWLVFEPVVGADQLVRAWDDLAAGRADPRVGFIGSLRDTPAGS